MGKKIKTLEISIPLAMLEQILQDIEEHAQIIDGEWGRNRSVKELAEENAMPEWYYTLKEMIKAKQG